MELLHHNAKQLFGKEKTALQKIQLTLSRCDLCLQSTELLPLLCQYCLSDLPLFHYNHANNLLSWPAIDKLFPKRTFDQLICLAPYLYPFNHWLPQQKYQNKTQYSLLLAQLLAIRCHTLKTFNSNTTMFVVPCHLSTWQQRGYNQSHMIAKKLARLVNCRYLPEALNRVKQKASQVGHTGKQRRQLMAKDFTVNPNVKLPEYAVLFDDVVTTGSTVNTISQLLKEHGVKYVTVLAVALSLPNR